MPTVPSSVRFGAVFSYNSFHDFAEEGHTLVIRDDRSVGVIIR